MTSPAGAGPYDSQRADDVSVVGFFVLATSSGAEHSLVLLASGCGARSRRVRKRASGECLPSPTPPEDALRSDAPLGGNHSSFTGQAATRSDLTTWVVARLSHGCPA